MTNSRFRTITLSSMAMIMAGFSTSTFMAIPSFAQTANPVAPPPKVQQEELKNPVLLDGQKIPVLLNGQKFPVLLDGQKEKPLDGFLVLPQLRQETQEEKEKREAKEVIEKIAQGNRDRVGAAFAGATGSNEESEKDLFDDLLEGEEEKAEKTIPKGLQRLDAAITVFDGNSYFFYNDQYNVYKKKLRATIRLNRSSIGFKALPKGLDAVLKHTLNQKTYFFKGDQYYRYDIYKKKIDRQGTVGVDGWRGLTGKIDAALSYGHNQQYYGYFFQGNKYRKYDYRKKRFVKGGIIGKDYWKGMPKNIDAALYHSNGKAYFFKGNTYYRFNFQKQRMDKTGTIGVDGWSGLKYARDTSRDNLIKLKITLTRIRAQQTNDSDNIGDYAIAQTVSYVTNGEDKKVTKKVVRTLSKSSSTLYRPEKRSARPLGKSYLLSSGGEGGGGAPAQQLHLYEGTTKTINNSVTFEITQAEARDKNAKFFINTKMIELDNCGKEWYKPGLYEDNSCDVTWIPIGKEIEVDIYEVLKYMRNPRAAGPNYFNDNGYRKYGAEGVVMKFKDDTNGALEGKLTMRTAKQDERHIFAYRFEFMR